ncbi:MAG: hypothetical protein PHV51_01965 [Methanosarcinaceae archaeon]|nr:hypothetical protein [Methanosarcinaceae archaeon]
MKSFVDKNRDILLDVTGNVFVIGLILLILHHFTSIIVSIWIDIPLLAIVTFTSGFSCFLVFIQKDEEYFKAKTEHYFRNLFLAGLLIITLGSLTFDFIEKSQILNSIVSFIFSIQFYLVLITIGFGFITFYFNRERIGAEADLEKEREERAEKKREEEFDKKFSFLTRFNLDYAISENWNKRDYAALVFRGLTAPFVWLVRLPYSFVRWMYREGWLYSAGLILIFSLYFITRLYENDFINGSDNYNVLGIKNMYENGISFYKYSSITDFLMLQIVKIFGFSLFTIKVPFITYSFITLIFIYLIGRLSNKNLALVSSFLYIISPWAIIQSRITRDYSFDLMIGSIVLYLCLIAYKNMRIANNIEEYVKYIISFSLIPFCVILLYEYNRQQTLVAGIYAFLTSIFILEYILKIKSNNKQFVNSIYWVSISSILLLALYFIEKFPFKFGFLNPDFIFIEMFFNPSIDSPWQWFHGMNFGIIYIFALFILGIFSFESNNLNKRYILILVSAFIFGLVLYILKYESHVEYIPVRYVYFLFIPYVVISANAILNLFKPFKTKLEKITIVILLILMINPTALIYSISPLLAYEEEEISNIQIDNVGIGRFKILEVVSYLENELNVNNETTIAFDGRYGEFIIYLNRPMDKERALLRKSNHMQYDVSKNTYVQSNYFEYYELKKAVENKPQGYYISNESTIFNETKIKLYNDNFYLYETSFKFIENINGYKIFSWNSSSE